LADSQNFSLSAKIDEYGRQGKKIGYPPSNSWLAVIGCFFQTETAQLYTCSLATINCILLPIPKEQQQISHQQR